MRVRGLRSVVEGQHNFAARERQRPPVVVRADQRRLTGLVSMMRLVPSALGLLGRRGSIRRARAGKRKAPSRTQMQPECVPRNIAGN